MGTYVLIAGVGKSGQRHLESVSKTTSQLSIWVQLSNHSLQQF